jgi:hypothetical protein
MASTDADSDEPGLPFVGHDEFRRGVGFGHFRIVVNPVLARPYVVRRSRIDLLAASVIGIGALLAVAGHALPGLILVLLGIAGNRLVRRQAGPMVLHMAIRDASVYDEVTSNGVMEVRRAAAT